VAPCFLVDFPKMLSILFYSGIVVFSHIIVCFYSCITIFLKLPNYEWPSSLLDQSSK
jgi:hypothetical protein